ncbi:MAG: 3-deoxy-D-manno-octulosonic acid transferase [Planctomycetes bacterium]|nr:3-deoxy-D-manno-octulosonic acid transferase [Planctomycetota bacterium]
MRFNAASLVKGLQGRNPMTSFFLNSFYFLFLIIASPWLAWRLWWKGRSLHNFITRFTGDSKLINKPSNLKTIWFHGVSVGEIHLLRQLVSTIQSSKPDWFCVVSSSTDNGLLEAQKCFKGTHVFLFPLDFSWAINKALSQIQPDLIVLAESELWPNFLHCCKIKQVPVSVINGRLSPRTQMRYLNFPWLAKAFFSKISAFAVQNIETENFLHRIGVPPSSTRVTGSIKFDGVTFSRNDPNIEKFKTMFGIKPNQLVWVGGSTQAPEEQYLLNAYIVLKKEFPLLRLILVPRQPDLFNQVRKQIQLSGLPFRNRSDLESTVAPEDSIILVDTLGELRFIWGLADIAFVGGSMDGQRGGQNMIEPAAYGSAVFFGNKIWNFKQVAGQLIHAGGASMISSPAALESTARTMLANQSLRIQMGHKAKDFVISQQGATAKTIVLLEDFLSRDSRNLAA